MIEHSQLAEVRTDKRTRDAESWDVHRMRLKQVGFGVFDVEFLLSLICEGFALAKQGRVQSSPCVHAETEPLLAALLIWRNPRRHPQRTGLCGQNHKTCMRT